MTTTQTTQRGRNGHWVPAVAVISVLASGGWLATQQSASGWGDGWGMSSSGGTDSTWDGGGVMGGSGYGWSDGGADRVDNLDQARDRVSSFAESLQPGLEVGEVMRFDNHFYADLQEPDGAKVTEVLIDPGSGAVQIENGPGPDVEQRGGNDEPQARLNQSGLPDRRGRRADRQRLARRRGRRGHRRGPGDVPRLLHAAHRAER